MEISSQSIFEGMLQKFILMFTAQFYFFTLCSETCFVQLFVVMIVRIFLHVINLLFWE